MAPALLLVLLALLVLRHATSEDFASALADTRGWANGNVLGIGTSAYGSSLDRGALLNENALDGLVNTNVYGTEYGRYSSAPYGQTNVNILGRSVYANENIARAIANANAVSRAIANANAIGYGAVANANAARAITHSNSVARAIANANAISKGSNANVVSYGHISKTNEVADNTNTNPLTPTISNVNSASGFQQSGVPDVKTMKHVKTAHGISHFKPSDNTVTNANSIDSLKHSHGLKNDDQTKVNIAQSSGYANAIGNASIKNTYPFGYNILSYYKPLGYNSLENPHRFDEEDIACLEAVRSVVNANVIRALINANAVHARPKNAVTNYANVLHRDAESNANVAHAIATANAVANANVLERLSHANAVGYGTVSHENAAPANLHDYANAVAYNGGVNAITDQGKHHDVRGVVYANRYGYGRLGASNAFPADTHDVHGATFPNTLLYNAVANANTAQTNNHKSHGSVHTNSFGQDAADNRNDGHSGSHDVHGVVNPNTPHIASAAHVNNNNVQDVYTNTFGHDSAGNSNAGHTNKHDVRGDMANTQGYNTYGNAYTGQTLTSTRAKPHVNHYYSPGGDTVATTHPVLQDGVNAVTAVANSNAIGGGAAVANAIADDRLTSTAGGHGNLEDGVSVSGIIPALETVSTTTPAPSAGTSASTKRKRRQRTTRATSPAPEPSSSTGPEEVSHASDLSTSAHSQPSSTTSIPLTSPFRA